MNEANNDRRPDVRMVIKRSKKLLGIKTDKELAEILGVRSNTISTWKARGSLDYSTLIALCISNHIDLNQLFGNERPGQGPDADKILVVPRELQYQYVFNAGDSNFIGNLPAYSFPFVFNRNLRAFEIVSPLGKMVLAIGEQLKTKANLRKKKSYVVVSRDHGILVGKVMVREPGYILIHAGANSLFKKDIRIADHEIIELWKVTRFLSFTLEDEVV